MATATGVRTLGLSKRFGAVDVLVGHPRRSLIEPAGDSLDKAARALEVLRAEMPVCCAVHLPRTEPDPDTGSP